MTARNATMYCRTIPAVISAGVQAGLGHGLLGRPSGRPGHSEPQRGVASAGEFASRHLQSRASQTFNPRTLCCPHRYIPAEIAVLFLIKSPVKVFLSGLYTYICFLLPACCRFEYRDVYVFCLLGHVTLGDRAVTAPRLSRPQMAGWREARAGSSGGGAS